MTISISIDHRAHIHIATPAGAGQLAVIGPDGTVIQAPGLSDQLRDALIEALLDELTPSLQRASRRLEPPPVRAVVPPAMRPPQRRRATRPSGG